MEYRLRYEIRAEELISYLMILYPLLNASTRLERCPECVCSRVGVFIKPRNITLQEECCGIRAEKNLPPIVGQGTLNTFHF